MIEVSYIIATLPQNLHSAPTTDPHIDITNFTNYNDLQSSIILKFLLNNINSFLNKDQHIKTII